MTYYVVTEGNMYKVNLLIDEDKTRDCIVIARDLFDAMTMIRLKFKRLYTSGVIRTFRVISITIMYNIQSANIDADEPFPDNNTGSLCLIDKSFIKTKFGRTAY